MHSLTRVKTIYEFPTIRYVFRTVTRQRVSAHRGAFCLLMPTLFSYLEICISVTHSERPTCRQENNITHSTCPLVLSACVREARVQRHTTCKQRINERNMERNILCKYRRNVREMKTTGLLVMRNTAQSRTRPDAVHSSYNELDSLRILRHVRTSLHLLLFA